MAYIYEIRIWFEVFYALGILSVIILTFYFTKQRNSIEKQEGLLPAPGIFIPLGIPFIIILSHFGEFNAELFDIRLAGVLLSLYFIIMLPWTLSILGRYTIPGAGIYKDHILITSGPFRFIRHPLYSAVILLWLGAAIGTLNWLLLAFWPAWVLIIYFVPVRQEEKLLTEKFGNSYNDYIRQTGKLIPWFYKGKSAIQ